ncbi:leucine-rich repeat domain-containing protein, partial [bacterium LRH843]|nr:leucine-rich repeat domain-containing protein [bacterium LRH843]
GLTDITIPNSVISIEDCAFGSCTGLIGITIPNSVTSIGHYAFRGCNNLEKIVIDSDNDAEFIRIKRLLPANLQSKVESFEEIQEKKAYRNRELNKIL